MKTVVFVSIYPFPEGTAESRRILCLAQGYVSQGLKVKVICLHKKVKSYVDKNSLIEAVSVSNCEDMHYSKLNKIKGMIETIRPNYLLSKALEQLDPKSILFFNINSRSYGRVKEVFSFAKKKEIPVLVDINEHYNFFSGFGGKCSPNYWSLRVSFFKFFKKADGVIAISHEISRIAKGMKAKSLIVPSVEDFNQEIKFPESPNRKQILYVGLLLDRDNPKGMVEFYKKLYDRDQSYELHIAGRYNRFPEGRRNLEFLQNALLQKNVYFHGEVTNAELEKLRENSIASFLLRRHEYVELCSFPTRLAEILRTHSYLITSSYGDVGTYLRGTEGVLFLEDAENMSGAEIALSIESWNDEGLSSRTNQVRPIFSMSENAKKILNFIESDV